MSKFVVKKKQPKSICMAAFPEQFAKLHPERGAAGGVKSRSASEGVRMAVYGGIRETFLMLHRFCQACPIVKTDKATHDQLYRTPSTQIHHQRGRDGLLLFDTRHFLACCAECHRFIHDNPAKAMQLGLLEKD